MNEKLKKSRGELLDMELMSEKFGNRFKMIQFASKRAYELRKGAVPIVDHDSTNSVAMTALLELQAAQ